MATKVTVRVDDRILRKLLRELQRNGRPCRIIADGVEYGIFQEFGTSKMGAHPFMTPAVEMHRTALERGLKQANDLTKADAVVEKVARDIERDAKSLAPVDTGALRSSIHVVDASGDYTFEGEEVAPGRVEFK